MQVRGITLLALIGALVATVVVGLGSPDPLRLHVRPANAGQLVKGNLVTVGGVGVGTVKDIALADDNTADVTLEVTDEDLLPLHEGTRADVRVSSLSSVANRSVALSPGPNDAPELADGATIATSRSTTPVEVDQVISTLDSASRSHLQGLIHGSAAQYAGATRQANATLAALNPAVAETSATLGELARDQRAFSSVIVDSAALMSTLSAQSDAVDEVLRGTAGVTGDLAARTRRIDAVLRRAPKGLDDTRRVFAHYDAVFGDLVPTARRLASAAPALREAVAAAGPALRAAGPALDATTPLLDAATAVLGMTPRLRRSGVPALRRTTSAAAAIKPILNGVVPYFPDVFHGLIGGFGGQTAGSYDANGNYVRLSLQLGLNSVIGQAGATGVRLRRGGPSPSAGNVDRCPGSATNPAPDGSSPFVPAGVDCDRSQTP